jgi:hypothetical protein
MLPFTRLTFQGEGIRTQGIDAGLENTDASLDPPESLACLPLLEDIRNERKNTRCG